MKEQEKYTNPLNSQPFLSQISPQGLIEQFTVFCNKKQVKLTLTDTLIQIGNIKVEISDAIGLKNVINQQKQCQHTYILYSYPIKNKNKKKAFRQVTSVKFQVKDIKNWQKLRQKIIIKIANRSQNQSFKLLICFNPNAGANSTTHLNKIKAFLQFTNLQYLIFTTQYRNHCLQYLKNIDVNNYFGVAIVSGDGLMHQFVNSFCDLPVTHVPAGSGNAFAKTQTQIAQQLCKDQQSIFLAIKNRTKQFNIIKYQLQKLQTPIYSFLALEWAIISDLDINSQFLRCLGGFRFQIYAAWRCLAMKRYPAKYTYSTIQKQLPPLSTPIPQNSPDYNSITQTFLHAIFCSIPYISDKYRMAPSVKVQQRLMDTQLLTQEHGRWQLIKYLLYSESGSHFNVQQNKPANGFNYLHEKVKGFRLEPLDPQQIGIFSIDGQAYEAQKIQASLDTRTFRAFV